MSQYERPAIELNEINFTYFIAYLDLYEREVLIAISKCNTTNDKGRLSQHRGSYIAIRNIKNGLTGIIKEGSEYATQKQTF